MEFMCAIDGEGEAPAFHVVQIRRKNRGYHTKLCDLCRKPIAPGDHYRHESGKWEGDIETHDAHVACHALMVAASEMICDTSWYLWGQTLDVASAELVALNIADPDIVSDEELRDWLTRHEAITEMADG